MRVAICDDELLAARQLERIVKKILERETGGVGVAPWADDYSVAAVTAVQGVISIRQDNYLFTGGAHGMPGRENHIFSETEGSEVTLASLLPLSEEEVNERAREAFLSRIEEHPEDGYFEDASDTIRAKSDTGRRGFLRAAL